MKKITAGFGILILGMMAGCFSQRPVQKLAKPMDQTAAEIVKVRELKREGKTRAVLSPADQKQVRIPF